VAVRNIRYRNDLTCDRYSRLLNFPLEVAVDRSIDTEAHQRLCGGLKRLRARAGFTQSVLAKRLGVRQTFVSAYERGDRRLDVVELRAIAVALGRPAAAVVAQLDALDAVLATVGDDAS
jgi:DNA-binding transcriptional regulator YiaG